MIANKDILDLIERKKFKNFWYSFDYLTQAGYSEQESLWHSVKAFGESNLFNNVAFVRLKQGIDLTTIHHSGELKTNFVIGFIDDDNLGLGKLFQTYHKWLLKNIKNRPQFEIENYCDKLTFKGLSEPMLKYLLSTSNKHYGFEGFRIKVIEDDSIDTIIPDSNNFLGTIQDVHKQMLDIVGIPAHLLGENTKTRII